MQGVIDTEYSKELHEWYSVKVPENRIYNERIMAVKPEDIVEVVKEVISGRKAVLLKSIAHYMDVIKSLNPDNKPLKELDKRIVKQISKLEATLNIRKQALEDFESGNAA